MLEARKLEALWISALLLVWHVCVGLCCYAILYTTSMLEHLKRATFAFTFQVQSWSNRLAASELSVSKLQAELAKRPEPHLFQVCQCVAVEQ